MIRDPDIEIAITTTPPGGVMVILMPGKLKNHTTEGGGFGGEIGSVSGKYHIHYRKNKLESSSLFFFAEKKERKESKKTIRGVSLPFL